MKLKASDGTHTCLVTKPGDTPASLIHNPQLHVIIHIGVVDIRNLCRNSKAVQ
jgi:hypothetical protein